ncbi:MAG TPA: PilZ domain-containing protein [Anaeromyxobacter sp.]
MSDEKRGPGASAPGDDDRRDSRRVPIELLVRDAAVGGSYETYSGNLALGGVFFDAYHPPAGSKIEVRFLVPGGKEEIRAVGEVLRVSREGELFGAHVRFVEIPLEAELAIARFLQGA